MIIEASIPSDSITAKVRVPASLSAHSRSILMSRSIVMQMPIFIAMGSASKYAKLSFTDRQFYYCSTVRQYLME